MTSVNAVETIATQLHHAIATGSHAEAAVLSEQYCRALEERVRGLDPQDHRLDQIGREALHLLEWARRTTLAHRARYAAQLSSTPDLRPYGASARPNHAWDLEA